MQSVDTIYLVFKYREEVVESFILLVVSIMEDMSISHQEGDTMIIQQAFSAAHSNEGSKHNCRRHRFCATPSLLFGIELQSSNVHGINR